MRIELKGQDAIDKNAVVPAYYQLAKLLETEILENKIKVGEVLPSENEIAASYNVSRMTVRKAISLLVSAGMVFSLKGKGNFVSKPKLDNLVFELKDSIEEVRKRRMKPSSKLLEVKIVKSDQRLARELEIPVDTNCIFFKLVVTADQMPLIYQKKYFVYEKQKPILENELAEPSLSNIAATISGRFPTISKQVLHASVVNEDEAKVLEIDVGTPAFVLEQVIYDSDKKPIGLGETVFRGDKFKLYSHNGWSIDNAF